MHLLRTISLAFSSARACNTIDRSPARSSSVASSFSMVSCSGCDTTSKLISGNCDTATVANPLSKSPAAIAIRWMV